MAKKFITAELKAEGDKIIFVASDETLDRHGEVVSMDSWDLKNYKKNPVLLVNHDYKVQNIVGVAKGLKKNDQNQLVFEPTFHGLTQLSQEVEAMVKGGVLNTVSVGFIPNYPKKEGQPVKNELIEISFVPVPANPSAERIKSFLNPELDEATQNKIKEFAEADTEEEEEIDEEEVETGLGEDTLDFNIDDEAIPDFDLMDDVEKSVEAKKYVRLSAKTFLKLVADSKKLKTLTGSAIENANQGRASKSKNKSKDLNLILLKQVV